LYLKTKKITGKATKKSDYKEGINFGLEYINNILVMATG